MTAHDDLEVLKRLGMYVHGEGSDEDGEEFDAALSRITEHVAELEAKKDLYTQVVGSKADLLAQLRRISDALREIAEERCPPHIEGDSEAIRYWQQARARDALGRAT